MINLVNFFMSKLANPVSWPLRIAIVLVLLIVAIAFGYVRGLEHEEKVFDQFKLQQQRLADAQVAHTAGIIQQQKTTTQEANNAFDQSLTAVRNYYTQQLHNQPAPSPSCGMPAVPGIAKVTNSATADAVPAAAANVASVTDCNRLAEQAAETTAQLVDAMHWAQTQSKIFNK